MAVPVFPAPWKHALRIKDACVNAGPGRALPAFWEARGFFCQTYRRGRCSMCERMSRMAKAGFEWAFAAKYAKTMMNLKDCLIWRCADWAASPGVEVWLARVVSDRDHRSEQCV